MRLASGVVFAVLVVNAPVAAFGQGDPAATGKAGPLSTLAAGLPAREATPPSNLVRADGVDAQQAQVLFAHAQAAIYLWDRDEVWLLSPDSLDTLRTKSATLGGALGTAPLPATVTTVGPATPRELVERVRAEHPDLDRSGTPRFLAMLPTHRAGSTPQRRPPAQATASAGKTIAFSETFESNPWTRWDRSDTTGGAYMWERTSCDRHGGAYSADAVRGGSVGSGLSCSASYADDTETRMATSSCVNIAGASQAWLDLWATGETEECCDYLALYFDDGTGHYWGYGYAGSYPGWWHVIHNLRQWWGIGDLTQLSCNSLLVEFSSDYSVTPGFGARIDDLTIRTDPLSGLSCSGSAAPASGPAPLTVAFTASAPGASAGADYYWYFGDGDSSTQPSTSHTYTAEGEYYAELYVEDGVSRCTGGARVVVTGACVVSCSASVPASGVAGVPVSFNASSSTSNCGTGVTYAWTFGDGGSSNLEDPSHSYTAPGSYSWSLVAAAGGSSCTRTGSITISGAQTTTYLVPGVAHAPGAAGTNWRTKLSVLNRSGAASQVTFDYVRTSKTLSEVVSLANGELRAWEDVAVDLFGVAGDSSGAVVVSSTRPLVVNARTYNVGASGTFGQFLPGVGEASALRAGDLGAISMLSKNSNFRTNIGFVNLGTASCTVRVTLRDPNGTAIGSQRTLAVPAQGWKQDNDIFSSSGAGTRNEAYATVEVLTSGCEVWGYGSVVDNATGDPTTVPLEVNAGAKR